MRKSPEGSALLTDLGTEKDGRTVHVVDEELDHGPIVLQAAVAVKDDDTEETLSARILKEEHRAYPKAIRLMLEKASQP